MDNEVKFRTKDSRDLTIRFVGIIPTDIPDKKYNGCLRSDYDIKFCIHESRSEICFYHHLQFYGDQEIFIEMHRKNNNKDRDKFIENNLDEFFNCMIDIILEGEWDKGMSESKTEIKESYIAKHRHHCFDSTNEFTNRFSCKDDIVNYRKIRRGE